MHGQAKRDPLWRSEKLGLTLIFLNVIIYILKITLIILIILPKYLIYLAQFLQKLLNQRVCFLEEGLIRLDRKFPVKLNDLQVERS